jgi:hypothetical protein
MLKEILYSVANCEWLCSRSLKMQTEILQGMCDMQVEAVGM